MADAGLAKTIDDAFEQRNDVGPATQGPVRQAVETALDLLDRGEARVAEKQADNSWRVNQWLKKAVLLSFRLRDNVVMGGSGELDPLRFYDKVDCKFSRFDADRFRASGVPEANVEGMRPC